MPGLYTTGFKDNDGADIGAKIMEKSYLIDVYPNLVNQQNAPGLWMWGFNNYGQLGDNSVTHKSSPVQTIAAGNNWKQISSRIYVGAGIKTDGTLWLWGKNTGGGLGTNDTTHRSSPIQTVAAGTNWKQVTVSGYTTSFTAAIKTDGTLWLWGANNYGQLGDNSSTGRSSPVQTVTGGTDWKLVESGSLSTAAIKNDGTLWLWGRNNEGQLGDNTVVSKSSPVQTVTGGTNWQMVALGNSYSTAAFCDGLFTAAIKTDGTLWTWGRNTYGQLGDNTIAAKSSPVQTVAGGTNWKTVSAGQGGIAAIKTDGTLWGCGKNTTGCLGDNTNVHKSSPVQTVAGGTNWKTVSRGGFMTAAIKTDGTLWTWGGESFGELGINAVTSRSSPVQTLTGGTNWKSVSAGYAVSAIRDSSL